MDVLKRAVRKSLVSYKGLFGMFSLKGYLLIEVINPIIRVSFFAMIAAYVYQTDDLSPWIIGNAMVLTYMNAFFGVGAQFVQERFMGTLKLVVAVPASSFGVFMPRVIVHMLDGMVSVLIGLLTGMVFFGLQLSGDKWIPFLTVMLVASFSAMGLGLLIGSLGLLTRDINLLLNIASMFLLALTGANFDIARLPATLQMISSILPLTRSIELARYIYAGGSLIERMDLLGCEIIVGMAFSIMGFIMFKYLENLSRVKGTLDLY